MKCKNLGAKCDYQEKLKPADGKGAFEGFDVFQCPKCKEVATTVKKSVIKKADIKKAVPEVCPSCGIEATEGNEVTGFKCPNCDQQPRHDPSNFAYEDLRDNTGLPDRINKFVSKSGIKKMGVYYKPSSAPFNGAVCNGCNQQAPSGHMIYTGKNEVKRNQPYDYYCDGCRTNYFPKAQHVDALNKPIVKGKTYKDAPNYEKKIDRLGPEGEYKRQQGKQEVVRASNMAVSDPTIGSVDRFKKAAPPKKTKVSSSSATLPEKCGNCGVPASSGRSGSAANMVYTSRGWVCENCNTADKINKFVSKAEKNIFGDMDKREQAEFYVPGDPDNINYLGFEKHKKGEVSKSIKKSIVKKGKLGGMAGGAIGTGLGYAAASKFGGQHGIPGGKMGRLGGAMTGGAIGTGLGSMAQDKMKRKDEDEEEKSLDKAADTPLYSIKKDNPDPDAAYDEMRDRKTRKPKIEPDFDAMKDDVDIEKLKRPSKAAGAAIGAGLGALSPLGPLGAAGGAYLGHKLGKDTDGVSKGTRKRSKSRRLKTGSASYGPKVPMAPQHSHVKKAKCPNCYGEIGRSTKCESCGKKIVKLSIKKAVPGWELPPIKCPQCGAEILDTSTISQDGLCGLCAGHGAPMLLTDKIDAFVNNVGKAREFETKGERREHLKRPRMPMSGRNTGEVYRNAVAKRAPIRTKPLHKIPKIEKAGAPILPCGQCGKPVPHFTSSPESTKGLCSECIRIKLTKPNTVKKGMWNNQKVCINPQCGWKKGYTKDDPRHATVQQSKSCPQCGKVTRDVPFSPDF